jgi:predicted nucleic acid-binding protein
VVLKKGLEYYSEHNFDFIDSILLGYNKEKGYKIYSFDKKMNKFMKKE